MAVLPFGVERLRTGPSPRCQRARRPPLPPRRGPSHVRAAVIRLSTSGGRTSHRPQGDLLAAADAVSRSHREDMGDVRGRPRMVAVVGASGGCGASTLTAAVCRAASSSGWSVVAVDAQPGAAGLDVVLSLDHVPGVRWPDLARLRGAVDGPDLIARLPGGDGVAVLSHGRDGQPPPGPEALAAVLAGLVTGAAPGVGLGDALSHPDLVVVDASRESTVGAARDWWGCVDLAVVVAGTGLVELAALSAVAAALDLMGVPVVLVLRGDRVPARLCDDVEDSLGVPVLVTVGSDPSVARDLVRGRAPGGGSGAVARAAGAILAAVGIGPTSGRGEALGAAPGRSSRRAS